MELARELGIVLCAVFTISLLYERLLAERHLNSFRKLLKEQIEQAASNAAACAELGILEIFASRSVFQNRYPLQGFLSELGKGGCARIVALSAFNVMNNPDLLRKALEQGSGLEFCLLNPASSPAELAKLQVVNIHDIQAAIDNFADTIIPWLQTNMPPGSVELRFHQVAVPESFCYFSASPVSGRVVWDLNFGRDPKDKRVLLVDPNKTLGLDLRKRFDFVFGNAAVVFQYSQKSIKINHLKSPQKRPFSKVPQQGNVQYS
jgi:hypothetical protein